MFWLFPENGSISERTVNMASTLIQPYKILHKKILIFIFAMYQNYPLALRATSAPLAYFLGHNKKSNSPPNQNSVTF